MAEVRSEQRGLVQHSTVSKPCRIQDVENVVLIDLERGILLHKHLFNDSVNPEDTEPV